MQLKKIKEIGNKLIEILKWDAIYTLGYSSVAALTNGLTNLSKGEDFIGGLEEAFRNHAPIGLAVNLGYPIIFDYLKKTNHYRIYSNLYLGVLVVVFSAAHYIGGTQHPIETMLPVTAIGITMVNTHVSKTKNMDDIIENG